MTRPEIQLYRQKINTYVCLYVDKLSHIHTFLKRTQNFSEYPAPVTIFCVGDKRKERGRLIEQYVNTRCYVYVSDLSAQAKKAEEEEQN